MKPSAHSFLISLFIILCLSSCEFGPHKSASLSPPLSFDAQEIGRELGRQHNEALAYMMQKLESRDHPFESEEQVKSFISSSITGYLNTLPAIMESQQEFHIDFDRIFRIVDYTHSQNKRSNIDLLFQNSFIPITSNSKPILQDLFAVYDQLDYELPHTESYDKKVEELQHRSLQLTTDDNDQLVIHGVSETLKASYEYWGTHRKDWIQELVRLHPQYGMTVNRPLMQAPPVSKICLPTIPCMYTIMIDWSEVIQEDGGGLIAGAAYVGAEAAWAALWGSTPQGWLAAGGIVAGSTAAFSAYEVYNQLVEIFDI